MVLSGFGVLNGFLVVLSGFVSLCYPVSQLRVAIQQPAIAMSSSRGRFKPFMSDVIAMNVSAGLVDNTAVVLLDVGAGSISTPLPIVRCTSSIASSACDDEASLPVVIETPDGDGKSRDSASLAMML